MNLSAITSLDPRLMRARARSNTARDTLALPGWITGCTGPNFCAKQSPTCAAGVRSLLKLPLCGCACELSNMHCLQVYTRQAHTCGQPATGHVRCREPCHPAHQLHQGGLPGAQAGLHVPGHHVQQVCIPTLVASAVPTQLSGRPMHTGHSSLASSTTAQQVPTSKRVYRQMQSAAGTKKEPSSCSAPGLQSTWKAFPGTTCATSLPPSRRSRAFTMCRSAPLVRRALPALQQMLLFLHDVTMHSVLCRGECAAMLKPKHAPCAAGGPPLHAACASCDSRNQGVWQCLPLPY